MWVSGLKSGQCRFNVTLVVSFVAWNTHVFYGNKRTTDWSIILFDKNKGLVCRRVKVQCQVQGQGSSYILLTLRRRLTHTERKRQR